ncbi:hypothetical protein CRG98_031045 [Punica granatum]|nr:hypothetical protein CRG98_031045 [Punica granatum]
MRSLQQDVLPVPPPALHMASESQPTLTWMLVTWVIITLIIVITVWVILRCCGSAADGGCGRSKKEEVAAAQTSPGTAPQAPHSIPVPVQLQIIPLPPATATYHGYRSSYYAPPPLPTLRW